MSPVLMQIGDWPVPAYGFFFALSLIAAWVIIVRLGVQDRLPADKLGFAYLLSVVTGILAARTTWVLQHPDALAPASMWSLPAGELAPFAGVVVGMLVSALYLASQKIPPTAAWDVAAPAFAVATIVERIGALMAGTGAGQYAPDLTWAIRFPVDSPVFHDHRTRLEELLPPAATESLPVHPTQVYAMVLAVIGLVLCLRWRARRKFSGQVALQYAVYALVARVFVEEWFRADAAQAVFGPLSGGQTAALVLIAALVAILRARGMRAAARDDGLRLWEGGRWSPPGMRPTARPSAKAAETSTSGGAVVAKSTAAGKGRGKGKSAKGKTTKGRKGRKRK